LFLLPQGCASAALCNLRNLRILNSDFELNRWSTAATKNERYNKKHQENHEQDVSNPSGFSRHPA
jgi:hypothetical protein